MSAGLQVLLVLLSPTAVGFVLILSRGIVGYLEPGLYEKVSERESFCLKQNTETTEDDTLMGTDVRPNVICRLMEFGYRCGRDSSTLTCVHDNANCGHQSSYETRQGPRAHLKILPAASEFWVAFPPTGWWTDNQGFTATAITNPADYYVSIWCSRRQLIPSFCATHGQHLKRALHRFSISLLEHCRTHDGQFKIKK